MKTLYHDEAFSYWEIYWQEAKRDFFKLEALQDYSGEEMEQSISYRLWLQGKRQEARNYIKEHADSWGQQTNNKLITKRRIHVVEEPYSPYLEWEIEYYKLVNIPLGGEEVYLVKKENLSPIIIPGDFMIFDDEMVANSHYNNAGKLISMDFYNKGEDIRLFLKLKKFLLARAEKLSIEL